MGSITLVTGGARSGKSDYALEKAEALTSTHKKIFIATCPIIDDEIDNRIQKHKDDRAGLNWLTIEEEVDLVSVITSIDENSVVLIDCVTLWINNLLYKTEKKGQKDVSEEDVGEVIRKVIVLAKERGLNLFFVTNEVGLGIVPADKKTRLYRDLVGRCNRIIAKHSQKVVLVSCGIPLILKNENN